MTPSQNVLPVSQRECTITTTRITFAIDVPLSEDDIRLLVHTIDEDNSGPGDGIDPLKVKGSDYLALWFDGSVQDVTSHVTITQFDGLSDSSVVVDTMERVD